jgi:hypothetical protein
VLRDKEISLQNNEKILISETDDDEKSVRFHYRSPKNKDSTVVRKVRFPLILFNILQCPLKYTLKTTYFSISAKQTSG